METNESTKGSQSRSLEVLPSSEGLETTSEHALSSDGGHRSGLQAITSPVTLHTKSSEPCSILGEESSDSLVREASSGHHRRFDFQPLCVSYITREPCPANDCSPTTPVPASSEHEPSSVDSSDPVSDTKASSHPGQGSRTGQGPDSGQRFVPGPVSGAVPVSSPGPQIGSSSPPRFRNLSPDLPPDYKPWVRHCQREPRDRSREPLEVPEPGTWGPLKPPETERKQEFLRETLPRGQCLLYNWEEERATNHLDQIPRVQDGSESFFFRHGHQGLLTIKLQSPMSSSTTQKDSYPPPRNICQPLRGKREAMLGMLLHHQICKEVHAKEEPTKKLFEAESVTNHELAPAGPLAPTKLHDYRQEQPETFWIQRAPQLPGVSDIRTLDTPFRKNSSFSTPVSLSLGQPLPYDRENFPHQMEVISSLACQEGGQGFRRQRRTH